MTENMKKLLELISQNEELEKKLSGLDKEGFIAAAKEQGIELTEADFKQDSAELSDDDLDAVAGGKTCICVLGGGGERSKNDHVCACVGAGIGETADKHNRCTCCVGGSGYNT